MGEDHHLSISTTVMEALGPLDDVEAKNAPPRLHLLGDRSLLRRSPRIAIVGSRRASVDGRRRAMRLARLVAERGGIVVSGLAEGIDESAHRAAIDRGGRTIAVIGTPLSRAYPAAHRDLQTEIGREHLLVSQFEEGTRTERHHFVLRNRTMALISHATVIVEAGETSGSLSQGKEALRLGRALYLMRAVAEDETLVWPKEMIGLGAQILADPDEFMSEFPPERFAHVGDAPF